MKNIERYMNDLPKLGTEFGILNGRPVRCEECDICEESCDIYRHKGDCECERLKWLNEEYIPHLEVDDKILVSSDGVKWEKRHFAKFKGDIIYAWADAKTSWTANDKQAVLPWKYWELPEENNNDK